MKTLSVKIIAISALVFIFLPVRFDILAINPARAASDTSVVIQPSKIEVAASPDQKLARSFSVINRSNFFVKLKLVVKDYRQISDDGKLEFYNATTEQASTWLVPQFLEIGLKPLETKTIGMVINVPKDFSGGGHYGAILFQSADGTSNINTVNFGELVLLTVTGSNLKTTAVAKSINFWTSGIQQGNPIDFNFKMQNTGNTHFDAQGKLILKNWLGKEIGNFDIGQITIYPNTSRVFKWRWNGTPKLGIYRAEVMLSDSATGKNFKMIDGMWFFIFPWQLLLIVLAGGLAVFAGIKYRQRFLFVVKWQKRAEKSF